MIFQLGEFDAERRIESARIGQGDVLALWYINGSDFVQREIECAVAGDRGLGTVGPIAGCCHCVLLLQEMEYGRSRATKNPRPSL